MHSMNAYVTNFFFLIQVSEICMNSCSDVCISEAYIIILQDKGKEWNIVPGNNVFRACF